MKKLFDCFLKKWNEEPKQGKKFMAKCGHECLIEDVTLGFSKTGISNESAFRGEIEFCYKCVADMAIRCVWCGELILIGDPVTLNSPNKDFKIPNWAVVYQTEPLKLVGCGRTSCCFSRADYRGYLAPEGKILKNLSFLQLRVVDPIIVGRKNVAPKFKIVKEVEI